jgi:hypothetical protein
MELTLLTSWVGLYFLSLAYGSLTGAKLPPGMNAKEMLGKLKEGSMGWMIFLPLIALFALLYNMGQTIVWAVGDLLGRLAKFSVSLINWIWKEVVIAGGYLLWRLFWHYIVLWPWRILVMAFAAIKPSFNWAHYRTASIGLFAAVLLVFIGNTLVDQWGWWEGLRSLFIALSLFPLGGALAQITNDLRKKSSLDAQGAQRKYWTVLGYVAVYFLGLLAIQALVVTIGMQTSFAFALSSLLIGGNLLASIFLIINGALLVFTLSALPNFALDYDGDHKGMMKSFGSYLWQTWARYGLGAYAFLVPAAIVSLVPTLITEGISYSAGKATSMMYSDKIANMEKALEDGSDANYADWLNRDSISDDSLAVLMAADAARAADKDALEMVKVNASYLGTFYDNHSSGIGATPLGACLGLFDWYGDNMASMEKAPDYDSTSAAASFVDTAEMVNEASQAQSTVGAWEEEIARRSAIRDMICNGPSDDEAAPADQADAAASDEPMAGEDEYDACANANAEVTDAENNKADAEAQVARVEKIRAHIDGLNASSEKAAANALGAGSWANFFGGIWMILLVALSLGMAVSLFAHLNASIYGIKDDKSGWYISEEISAAHKASPNQPLLGIILFLPLFNLFVWASDYVPSYVRDTANEQLESVMEMITPQNSYFYSPEQMMDRVEREMRGVLNMPEACCEEGEGDCCNPEEACEEAVEEGSEEMDIEVEEVAPVDEADVDLYFEEEAPAEEAVDDYDY